MEIRTGQAIIMNCSISARPPTILVRNSLTSLEASTRATKPNISLEEYNIAQIWGSFVHILPFDSSVPFVVSCLTVEIWDLGTKIKQYLAHDDVCRKTCKWLIDLTFSCYTNVCVYTRQSYRI